MPQATASLQQLVISLSDNVSGNIPMSKSVSGAAVNGLLNEYIPQQMIGLSTPINLGASAPAQGIGQVNVGGFLTAATYYYKVTALNGTGETLASSEVSAAINSSTGSVVLAWGAVAGAASYRVYRGTVSNGQSVYYTSPTNSYTDTGAWATAGTPPGSNSTQLSAPGTVTPTGSGTGGTLAANTYYYKVTALNGAGETAGSSEANVTVSGSTSSVGLAWAAVTGATSYKIYRGTTTNSENIYFTSSTNSFTDTGAAGTSGSVPGSNTTQVSAPGTVTPAPSVSGGALPAGSYYYKVTAVNEVGETTASSEATATTIGSAGSVTLTWPAVAGAVSYNVYRGTSSSGENKVVNVSTNSFTDSTVPSSSGAPPTSNGTGTSWSLTLPVSPIQFLYMRNNSTVNTFTPSVTPSGGSSQTLSPIAPGGILLLVGCSLTAVSGSASAPGTPIEAIVNG